MQFTQQEVNVMKTASKKIYALIALIFLISLIIPFASIFASVDPEVSTKHLDYKPGHKVMITGDNFLPNESYEIVVTRPDGSIVKGDGSFEEGSDIITSNKKGGFKYKYQLAEISDEFDPTGGYYVDVFDSSGDLIASTTFTDSTVRW